MYNFDLGIEDPGNLVRSSRQFSVGDMLEKNARVNRDVTAVQGPAEEYSYAELNDRVNALSDSLLARGVDHETGTVAVLSENRPEFVELIYAGAKLGTLVATLNWRLAREELVHCVDLVDPDVVFISETHWGKRDWLAGAESDPEYVSIDGADGASTYAELLEEGDTDEPLPSLSVDSEQGLLVEYTSGTTGLPKATVLSHRAQFARTYQLLLDMGLKEGDSYVAWSPMFHMSAVDWVVTCGFLGGTYYTVDGFGAERIVEVLVASETPIGYLFLVPGTIERLIEYIEDNGIDSTDFPEIRCTGALADLLDPAKIERITELLDAPYMNPYGLTEAGWVATDVLPVGSRPTKEELSKRESPLLDVKLIDEDWNEVPQGTPGEAAVRGPPLCSGYLDDPETNRTEFRDGWFRTGDVLVKNDDGTYDYINRRQYLIKSGGENIYPGEIERVLLEHELIDDAVVVRVPDEKWGEVPKVYVSTDRPDELAPTDVMRLLDGRIANYKLPHYVEIIEPGNFPRSTTGKVIRADVEEWPVSEEERVRDV